MNLILWRHAEAADGSDDFNRALTKRGRKQALRMAAWLAGRLPADCRILVSPTVRTRQTAEALGLPYDICSEIAPAATANDLFVASGWPDGARKDKGSVLLVGHQPALGGLLALLLSGEPAAWSMRKGSICWLQNRQREGGTQTFLRAVMPVDLLD